jgi:pimeloyl-ACP methyl ester carboxylesterase
LRDRPPPCERRHDARAIVPEEKDLTRHERVLSSKEYPLTLQRSGNGAPLLVLHDPFGAVWNDGLSMLSESFDVLLPQHPGFGGAPVPAWLDTVHDLAYFYLDVMDALDLKGVHLVGSSLGGWIAAEIAVRSTARLATLTLAGAMGLFVKNVPLSDTFLATDELRVRESVHDSALADAIIAQTVTDARADEMLQDNLVVARLTWQPRNHDPHLHKWLHRIKVPTLLIWGEEDRIVPPVHGEAYQRHIEGAKLVTLPRCGHLPLTEQPKLFADHLTGFISKCEKAS